MNKRDLAPLLLGALAVVIVGLLLLAGPKRGGTGGGPWRESTDPSLRRYWDTLEGKPAPPLTMLSGWVGTDARGWADLRGKVVLIDIWGTWCPPCIAAIPHLVELYEKYHDAGLVVLGAHSASGAEHMQAFVKGRKLPYAFAADTTGDLAEQLGIRYYPTYFVVDRQGIMRYAGAHPYRLEDIVKLLLDEDEG